MRIHNLGMPSGTHLTAIACIALVAAAPRAHAQDASDIAGEWSGGYICNQGPTALRLSITRDVKGEGVTAVFRFGPDASNPGVARGAYSMRGQFKAAEKRLILHAQSWINHPAGYVMVDLEGLMRGSGFYISGDILGPGCTQFELVRQGDEPIA